jgi:cytochrome P450
MLYVLGDVVRTAPNDLSFATLQSYKDIYGHATKGHVTFLKGEWYDQHDMEPGIVTVRDPEKHREMRRSLAHGFSAQALRDQKTVVLHYVDLFISQINKFGQQETGINMEEVSIMCLIYQLANEIVVDLAYFRHHR